jgi:hypothetical protein
VPKLLEHRFRGVCGGRAGPRVADLPFLCPGIECLCGVYSLVEAMVGVGLVFGLVWIIVVIGGTLLVAMASLERTWGRPIPRLKYSKPLRRQRFFCIVPVLMVVVWIGMMGLLLQTRTCSHCPAPYVRQNPVQIVEASVVATAFAGGSGFALFVIVWLFYAAWRGSTAALHRVPRADNRAS